MSKSPNYMSRQGWKPDMIVLHVCEGGFAGSVSWLCNPASQTSSHYVTGRNGELEQLVDLDKASWCNGTSVREGATYDYRRSTNRLVRERRTNANYYSISIENEGYSYKDGYGELTEPQYQTVLKLCRELIAKYNIPVDREHIVGHYEIAPKEKPNCPGPKFQWDRLMKDLGGTNSGSTSNQSSSTTQNSSSGIISTIQSWYNSNYSSIFGTISVDNSFGPDSKKHFIKAVQYEMNKQYGCHLDRDGSFGPLSKSCFKDLKRGCSGNITRICQAFLYAKGYNPNGFDGLYGPGMTDCVRRYQSNHGLHVDGILGPSTAYSLFN